MWFQTPLASEAACNDLVFYKKMLECQANPKLSNIFERVIPAMNRHFWYLTEELLPFALCSTQLAHEEKEVLARKLFNVYLENQHMVFEPQKPIFSHIIQSTQMSDLVGLMYSCFNISSSALMMFDFCAVLTISGLSMTCLRDWNSWL